MAASGIITLIAYLFHARNNEHALYAPSLFAVRTFRLGLAGNLVSRLGMSALPFLLPLLLQVAFGYSAISAGWLLMPIALAAIAVKPLIKPIVTRLGYRHTMVLNTRIIGILIASLAALTPQTPLWLMFFLLFAIGAANSVQFTGMNTLTMADLRSHQASSGSSLMGVNQQLAISFGIAIGALLLQSFSQASFTQYHIETAFRLTFLIMGLMTFLSSWVFARLHPLDGDNLVHQTKTIQIK